MSDGPRYAIYSVPAAESRLYRFGASVIGYDCYAGADIPHPDTGLRVDWPALTEAPRKYGFHATLKAPFHLSPQSSEDKLASALASFAALGRHAPVALLVVRDLDGFIALIPKDATSDVDALAADCTTIFDAFRAPMSATERARRLASGLSAAEAAHLDRWGYPYVFDRFRFHMTLTGRLEAGRRDAVLPLLKELFARSRAEEPVAIDRIALMRQDHEQARFRVVHSVKLGS